MRVFYKFLFTLIFSFSISAAVTGQLPDGSIAQDWTLTDINGNEHSLYADYLDQGKSVIIDFSATWCGPCWSYHNTHIVKDLYDDYGPNATNEIMAFHIEADFNTNTNCLYGSSGCNSSTQGNWVAGTPYPIIDLQPADAYVKTDYQISYYPTLYAVCPDRKIYEVGQSSYNTWKTWLLESCPLDASSVTTDVDCYNDMNGSVDLTTFEGYGNLSFSWSNGENTEDISNLFPGVYTCTISDAHNRSIETGDIVVVGPDSAPQADIMELNDISCFGEGDGYISLSGSGGSPGYTFEWSNGGSGPVQSGLAAGNYTVTIQDSNSCQESFTMTIEEPVELTASVSGTDENCGGSDGSILISAAGGNGGNYYDIGNAANYTGVFVGLPAGNYNIVVTDINGCSVQLNQTLVNNLAPVAEAGPTNDLDCINTLITLDGTGSETGPGIVYLWSTTDGNIVGGATSLNPEVDAPGTYQLQVFDTNTGCISTDEVNVGSTVDLPFADAGEESSIDCATTEIQLDGTGSDSGSNIIYSWTTVDGNIVEGEDSPSPFVNAAGTYVLEVTNEQNGCSSTDEVVVMQNGAIPAANAGEDGTLNCNVLTVQLDGSASESGPDITYSWSTEDGNIIEGENTAMITVDASGTYILLVTNESNGCTNTSSATVTSDTNLPEVEFEQDVLNCIQQTVSVCAQSQNNVSYLWQDGSTTACIEVTVAGPVTVQLTGDNGCSAEFETIVEENVAVPIIMLEADFAVDCNFTETELTATGDTGEGYSLIWSTADGNIVEGEGTVSPLVNAPGTYILEITNDSSGCTASDSIVISQTINTPVALFAENINGALISFEDDSEGEPNSWMWDFGDGEGSTEQNPEHIYTESGIYEVCLTIVNECGEDQTCHNIEVIVTGALSYSAIVVDLSCNGANDGSISITIFGGQPGYSVIWTGPDGFSADELNISGLSAGNYTLEVTDEAGSVLTAEFTINEPSAILYTPETIQDVSCNGDADGFIVGVANGGQVPLEYIWNTGDTSSSISDLAAGNYSCTVTDANGCKNEFTYEISQPDELILVSGEIMDASNGEANGSIDIDVSGGTQPYEYAWSTGESSEDIENLAEGSYSCVVTDANGCMINLGPFEVMNSTATSEMEGLTTFAYFPNPASDHLLIELSFDSKRPFNISLISRLGQTVKELSYDTGNLSTSLDLKDLNEGMYFLLISKNGQSIVKKIIVQR